jgi:hypothetical protein
MPTPHPRKKLSPFPKDMSSINRDQVEECDAVMNSESSGVTVQLYPIAYLTYLSRSMIKSWLTD